MKQENLFDQLQGSRNNYQSPPSLDKFQGALIFSAIGDALGWPTEFLKPQGTYKPPFGLPVRDFVEWRKLVGGKWWGYEEIIAPGEYSDDTQLTLAVARCISDIGVFEPERFAYEELPLWLHYERGGGRSIKAAARKLISKRASWLENFYKQGDINYMDAGANGAAMRNLPISLVNFTDEMQLIRDSFLNAIITHGHPRAILGAIIFGLAVKYVLTESNTTASTLIEYLSSGMEQVGKAVANDNRVSRWLRNREKTDHEKEKPFKAVFYEARDEASDYLEAIQTSLGSDTRSYYDFVGALNPATKGSGLATVCAAIYLFLKHTDQPEEAMINAINILGSDTDTIAVFLGSLLGAFHGLQAVPPHLAEKIQDRDYILKMAARLHAIATDEPQEQSAIQRNVERREAYLRILAWEIGLHEMFWDAIDIGGIVAHPTLGLGTITRKIEKSIPQENYIAKLIHINFNCGQSCVFHSRVQNGDRLSESLSRAIEQAL